MTRILVASEFAPDAPGGGPAVIRQMLRGLPRHDLYWWSCFPGNPAAGHPPGHAVFTLPRRLYPYRRFAQAKSFLLERLWAPWAAAHLHRTVRTVRPDVVWVIPHNWAIFPLHEALVDGRSRLHATVQDFPDVHDNPARFGAERCRRMATLVEALYSGADTRDATSLPMLEELRRRTGAAGSQMLHQGLEAEDFEFLEGAGSGKTYPASPIRIAYAGTVLVEAGFTILVRALERFRESAGQDVVLDFFGAHSYARKPWFRAAWMREHGNLGDRELLGALRQCHFGFIPMHLEDHDPRYNRFSFPTKFITYLAAGLPVIAFGHPESSVMKMAGAHELGLCWHGGDEAVLEEGLRRLLREPRRERWVGELLRCARAHFDAQAMRGRLWQCLESGRMPG